MSLEAYLFLAQNMFHTTAIYLTKFSAWLMHGCAYTRHLWTYVKGRGQHLVQTVCSWELGYPRRARWRWYKPHMGSKCQTGENIKSVKQWFGKKYFMTQTKRPKLKMRG